MLCSLDALDCMRGRRCIFELWFAIGLGNRCNLSIILTPEDRKDFRDAIVTEGYGVVDAVLDGIHAESAEAYSADDLASIRSKVNSTPGGFPTLNETVKSHLAHWFEGQGGMKVAHALIEPSVGHRRGRSLPALRIPSSSSLPDTSQSLTPRSDHERSGPIIFPSPGELPSGRQSSLLSAPPSPASGIDFAEPSATPLAYGFGDDLDRAPATTIAGAPYFQFSV